MDLSVTFHFTKSNVDKAPDKPGVYALFDGNELIYYGRATKSIRVRLQRHRNGDEGPCTQGATHYQREVTDNSEKREIALLFSYRLRNKRLPRCNERIG